MRETSMKSRQGAGHSGQNAYERAHIPGLPSQFRQRIIPLGQPPAATAGGVRSCTAPKISAIATKDIAQNFLIAFLLCES